MDAESCELAGGGEGNVVLEMEDDFSSHSQPGGRGAGLLPNTAPTLRGYPAWGIEDRQLGP